MNGFINDNYIMTAIEADCFGESVTFFVIGKRWGKCNAELEFILHNEDNKGRIHNYVYCDCVSACGPFTLESVTERAKDYLKKHALEMYASMKRKLQAEKASVSFSYSDGNCDIKDDNGCSIAGNTYNEDRMCISLPSEIFGEEVCDIINTFDGGCEIAVDKEEKAVKIYHSIVENNERFYPRSFKAGVKNDKTNVRTFLNSTDSGEDLNDYDDEQELYDKSYEEEAKQILSLFDVFCDTKEEIPTDSEEDSVLV